MKVYIDNEYRCHTTDDGTRTLIEDIFFDDKCEEFIEGYCYIPDGAEYPVGSGNIQIGTEIFPVTDLSILDRSQRSYEKSLIQTLKEQNADMKSALEIMGNTGGAA